MCDPVSATVAIGAVIGLVTAKKSADSQADALGVQGQQRADQINATGSAQLGIRARQARLDQARAEVSGGEAGLKGNSYEANLSNIASQANNDKGTIEANTKNNIASNQNDISAAFSRIKQPDYAGSALTIAGAGYSGYKSANEEATALGRAAAGVP